MKNNYKFKLPKDTKVQNISVNVKDGDLLIDVEFEERFEPKDGDFLCTEKEGIFIYNGKHGIIDRDITLGAYVGQDCCGRIKEHGSNHQWAFIDKSRYATEQEKADFLERLEKECHKCWNAYKKCLEDIYTPKFGDIVKVVCLDDDGFTYNYMICIYPKDLKDISKYKSGCFNIANLNYEGKLDYLCSNAGTLKIYPASEEEKQRLFDKLREDNKKWNPKTMQLEDIRWKPKDGEIYWFINEGGCITRTSFAKISSYDILRVTNNNCFKTEEAAVKVANQIGEIFKTSKAE